MADVRPDPRREEDLAFARYRAGGDPEAMARVFDLTASRLLLLAMHLVRDGAQAEDLVQTTFLQAIQDVDRFDDSRGLMPWLVGILTHRAADLRRQRDRHGSVSAQGLGRTPDPGPGPRVQAEHAEIADRLTQALDGLPRTYRQVMVLRMVHGLRAVEIAHSLDRSPQTVRTQLRHGLELLRQVLPKSLVLPSLWTAALAGEALGSGGMAAVRIQVLTAAKAASHAALPAIAAGSLGVLMMKKLSIAAALAAACTVLFLWSPWTGDAPAGGAPGAIAEEELPTQEVPASPRLAGDPAPEPEREVLAAPDGPDPAAVAAGEIRMVGRCVDAVGGAPLAGCQVRLLGGPAGNVRMEAHGKPVEFRQLDPVITGVDGKFAFRFEPPPPYQFHLSVSHPERVERKGRWPSLEAGIGETVDFGDVPLAIGCRVTGRVVDDAGRPRPKAVLMWNLATGGSPFLAPGKEDRWARLLRSDYQSVVTDAAGNFSLRAALHPGKWRLAPYRGFELVRPKTVSIEPGQLAAEIEVVVRDPSLGEHIAGVVVDQHGKPVVGVHIDTVPPPTQLQRRSVVTGADGTFLLPRLGKAHVDRVRIRAGDPFHRGDFEPRTADQEVGWNATGVRVVVQRAPAVEVVVVDGETGEPVEDFGLRLFLDPRQGRASSHRLRLKGNHPGGRVQVPGVHRGRNFLQVEPSGGGYAPGALQAFEASPEGAPAQRVVLHPPVRLQVQVVRADNSPVVGTRVELVREIRGEPVTAQTRILPPSDLNFLGPLNYGSGDSSSALARLTEAVRWAEGTTGADGKLWLEAAPGTGYSLRILGPGHQPRTLSDVSLAVGQEPLRVEVPSGATLFGRLTPEGAMAKFQPPADEVARLKKFPNPEKYLARLYPALRFLATHPGGEIQFPPSDAPGIAVDADGTFECAGIPPGDWRVRLECRLGQLEVAVVRGLREGERRNLDLDGGGLLPGVLVGRVLLDGEPVVDARFQLMALGPANTFAGLVQGKTDGEGRFRIDTRQATYQLEIDAKAEGWPTARKVRSAERVRVTAGSPTEHLFELRRTSLRVRVFRSDGVTPFANRELTLKSAIQVFAPVYRTDAQGWLTMDPCPPGALRLQAWPEDLNDQASRLKHLQAHQATWAEVTATLSPVQVPAGKSTAEVELRLPAGFE